MVEPLLFPYDITQPDQNEFFNAMTLALSNAKNLYILCSSNRGKCNEMDAKCDTIRKTLDKERIYQHVLLYIGEYYRSSKFTPKKNSAKIKIVVGDGLLEDMIKAQVLKYNEPILLFSQDLFINKFSTYGVNSWGTQKSIRFIVLPRVRLSKTYVLSQRVYHVEKTLNRFISKKRCIDYLQYPEDIPKAVQQLMFNRNSDSIN